MRIKSLKIRNFRSFDNEGIELTFPEIGKPFSIVGHNNSGKSNLINSILFGLNNKATNYGAFDQNDFNNCDTSKNIEIKVEIDPPILNPNMFNKFNDICGFNLKVECNEGVFESSHYCVDTQGKSIFNPTSLKRGTKASFTEEEKKVLNAKIKQGAQTAFKWKDKVPLYFIDPMTIQNQLKAHRGTLLGKVLLDIRKEFESKDTRISNKAGVLKHHVGQPNSDVFDKMLEYIEKQVIPTEKLDALTNQIKETLKKELEIQNDDFDLGFGFPSVESFYKNLEFYVKEHENKPKLPISRFGNGFILLFVISLFKAIIETEKGGNIFIIEEPETFLHEHYQEYFYKILESLSEKNQVIYTTHSKKFINLFEPKSILKLKTPEFLRTEVIHHPFEKLEIPEKIEDYQVKGIQDFAVYMKTLEPNLGNIIFAKKVIIVEGPHDVLGYTTVLASKYNLEYNNISIVAAWGKDTLKTIIAVCNLFEIKKYVIHDLDLQNSYEVALPKDNPKSIYNTLEPKGKTQYTKNFDIYNICDPKYLHHNIPNLEGVLDIKNKGATSVYENLSGKTVEQVFEQYPNFLPESLIQFIEE